MILKYYILNFYGFIFFILVFEFVGFLLINVRISDIIKFKGNF